MHYLQHKTINLENIIYKFPIYIFQIGIEYVIRNIEYTVFHFIHTDAHINFDVIDRMRSETREDSSD